MQTEFTLAQLADPDTRASEKILRTCVHCGFCTATCPTYVLLGNELDSPRGRIYLMKQMLESEATPSDHVVTHLDRCLSCLSCMSTCPSGVNYMHLVDHARTHVERTYRRSFFDWALREYLAWMLPHPFRFRLALLGAWFAKPFAPLVGNLLGGRVKAMLSLAPAVLANPSPMDQPQVHRAEGPRRARVAFLPGCAQQVLGPHINEATIRLLTRHGVEVVVARGTTCCGAVTHHMGKIEAAHHTVCENITAWSRELAGDGLDAIVTNVSGCGTMLKDYGFMMRESVDWKYSADRITGLVRDISEFMLELGLKRPVRQTGQVLAYHSACSMQHGQQLKTQPPALLRQAGFEVREPAEGHLCCGSAGTYNILQPAIALALRDRKLENLQRLEPDAVAMGNIGCITQLATGTDLPMVHTVEFLDWATGGPLPPALTRCRAFTRTQRFRVRRAQHPA